MLPFLSIFGLKIPMFGLMMLAGMIAAFGLLWFTRRIVRFSEDTLLSCALWAIISGFVGSKILYWIVDMKQFLVDPMFFIKNIREGFVFYGALIGGVLGVFFYSFRKKQPFFAFMDLFAPSLTLAHAFGRIGCFCAGCCYGSATHSFLGVRFPVGSLAPSNVSLLPTQLLEAAFLFLLTASLVWLLKKRRTFGTVTGWYLILYGVWRFFIEFYRGDDRGAVGLLSTSQFIAIFMMAAGAVLLILISRGIVSRGTLPEEDARALADESPEECTDSSLSAEEASSTALPDPTENPPEE